MSLTPKQAWAVAHLVAELRPDWQTEGVVAALKRCADGSPFLVALAAIRAAADGNLRTPGAIPTAGDHWDEGIKSQPRTSFNTPCPDHPGETLPCGRCARDRVPADDNPALALARAQLASARANLCSHGVPHQACADHDPRKAKPEPTTDAKEAT